MPDESLGFVVSICMFFCRTVVFALAILISVAPSSTKAQTNQTANIHGVVTDASGAAIAGVKITLTSPALLVAQTSASDASGLYHFEQLPLGTYSMTFDQAGFEELNRENITLTAGFSAEVNVQLTVGALTQSVTVSEVGPVIDTTSTEVATSLAPQVLANELPVTRTLGEVVGVTPGIAAQSAPDLGGGGVGTYGFTAYGLTGQEVPLIEGISSRQSSNLSGSNWDITALEELQVVPIAGNAEVAEPGVFLNAIVKSGGDKFHARGEANGENSIFESNNLTPYIRSQGTTTPSVILNDTDLTGQFGGPFIKTKWWFFVSGHLNRNVRNAIGYLVDGQPGSQYVRESNVTFKTTYQLTKNYKLIGFWTEHRELFPTRNASAFVPLASTVKFTWNPHEWKGEIQGTPNSHLVVDFFSGRNEYQANYYAQPDPQNIPSQMDISTQLVNGPTLGQDRRPRSSWQETGSLSYLPPGSFWGHHDLKFGASWMYQFTGTQEPNAVHGNYQLIFNAGNPVEIKMFNYPITNFEKFNEGGVYAEDTWQVNKRVTVNIGLRFDDYTSWVPAQTKPVGAFGPPWIPPVAGGNPNLYTGVQESFPYINGGAWRNVAPRIGVVWDIFGDGKTVLKGSYGRYNWTPADDFASAYNVNTATITTFKWTGPCPTPGSPAGCDYVPGTVNLNPNGPAFLSLTGGSNGGAAALSNTAVNPNLSEQYSNVYQAFIERELAPGISGRFGFTYVEDLDQWDQIPIQTPLSAWNIPYTVYDAGRTAVPCPSKSSTLPSTCPTVGTPFTIDDLNPAYKGAAFSQQEYFNRPGDRTDHFGTIEATVIKQPSKGKWTAIASYSATREHRWISTGTGVGSTQSPIITSPNQQYFPLDTTWNWTGRLTGNYNLPWKFDIAGTYQIYNGLQGQRTDTFLLANSTVTIPVERFGAETGPFRALLNIRIARDFHTERHGTFRPSVEILNLLNSAAPWTINFVSGATFGKYTVTDTPRILRAGLVYSF